MNTAHSVTEGDEIDLRAIVRPIRARWWLVLLIVVGITVAAYVLDARQTKVYQASTSIYVNLNDNVAAQFAAGSQQFQVNTGNQLADLAQLLQSPSAVALVERRLHRQVSPSQLTVVAQTNTDFIDITASDSSGPGAAAVANAFARAFIKQGQEQVNQELRQLVIQTVDQLSALPGRGLGVALQRTTLTSRLNALRNAQNNPNLSEQQVVQASAPTIPVSPRPTRTAVFAFFAALVAATLLVYLLERLDQRIKDLNQLVALYKLPLLASIPHTSNAKPQVSGLPTTPQDALEPLRMLRVSIDLQPFEAPPKLILVTSAMTNEGKSTVARNLALAYLEAGRDVVLVDADLRKQSLADEFLPDEDHVGLVDVVLSDVAVRDAETNVSVRLPAARDEYAKGELTIVPGGAPAANPPAILGSARAGLALAELAAEHDVVIVDSPPLLPVSDTLPLLSAVDAVVLVGRLKFTRRDAIRRVRGVISEIGSAPILGVIANDVATSGRGYLYGYGPYEGAPARQPKRSAASPSA